MRKRIISVLLAAVMCLSVLPLSVAAAASETIVAEFQAPGNVYFVDGPATGSSAKYTVGTQYYMYVYDAADRTMPMSLEPVTATADGIQGYLMGLALMQSGKTYEIEVRNSSMVVFATGFIYPKTAYDVAYAANNGTEEKSSVPGGVVAGSALNLADPAELGFAAPEGEEFDCWNVFMITGETVSKGIGDPVNIYRDQIITAQWKESTEEPAIEYTVAFDANGGEGDMDDVTVTEGETFTLPENAYTMENGTFMGWSLTADGEVILTDGQEDVEIDTLAVEADEDNLITLYAVWQIGRFVEVTVNVEGQGTVTGIATGDKIFENQIGEIAATPAEGYTFARWALALLVDGLAVDGFYWTYENATEEFELKSRAFDELYAEFGDAVLTLSLIAVFEEIVIPTVTASAEEAVMGGMEGKAINEFLLTLTIEDGEFDVEAGADVTDWFNLPAGLIATVTTVGEGEIEITISGTPEEIFEGELEITVPAGAIADYDAPVAVVVEDIAIDIVEAVEEYSVTIHGQEAGLLGYKNKVTFTGDVDGKWLLVQVTIGGVPTVTAQKLAEGATEVEVSYTNEAVSVLVYLLDNVDFLMADNDIPTLAWDLFVAE